MPAGEHGLGDQRAARSAGSSRPARVIIATARCAARAGQHPLLRKALAGGADEVWLITSIIDARM